MRLERVFLERCQAHADRPFVIEGAEAHSYGEVLGRALGVAVRLREVTEPGSRVALLLPTGEPFAAALFGALLAGCTVMPVDPRLAAPEISFLLAHGEISALVSDLPVPGASCPVVSARAAGSTERWSGPVSGASSAGAGSAAVMLTTSGSTSSPRVVLLSHENLLVDARAWNARYGIARDDGIATPLAACHSFGLTACVLSALDAGARLIVCEDPLPASVASAIAEHRATVLVAASSFHPWLTRSLGVSPSSLSSLRLALGGACPLSPSAAEAFQEKFGLPVLETYGLTEASPVVTATPPGRVRRGAVGTALDGIELRVIEGEVQVRGATVMLGYWRNAGATAAALPGDGWLRTGDLASIDDDGYLTILGRRKDLILRAGEKIYPEEIEEVLAEHPGVIDSAVIGRRDAAAGEIPVAFVSGEGLDAAGLIAFCRTRLAAFKVPRRIEIVQAIPRNANGKVLRRVLRERGEGGLP